MNVIDANGWSPLHHAAYIGDVQAATKLLESGASVNAYSNQQRTPLHLAAMQNQVEVVKTLMLSQAEMEWKDELKCTPLHLACKKGSIDSA